MKILAFVDLHGRRTTLKKIVARANKDDIDMVVNAGDLTIFGDKLNSIARELSKIKKPIIMLPYNHETDEEIKNICKKYPQMIYLQKKWLRKKNYLFMGYGGGGFTFIDKKFEKLAVQFKKLIKKGDRVILISHAPPYNTKLDILENGEHCGNKSIRKFIDKEKPNLVICGHIHPCANKKQKIGKSLIINPGWKGKVIEI